MILLCCCKKLLFLIVLLCACELFFLKNLFNIVLLVFKQVFVLFVVGHDLFNLLLTPLNKHCQLLVDLLTVCNLQVNLLLCLHGIVDQCFKLTQQLIASLCYAYVLLNN